MTKDRKYGRRKVASTGEIAKVTPLLWRFVGSSQHFYDRRFDRRQVMAHDFPDDLQVDALGGCPFIIGTYHIYGTDLTITIYMDQRMTKISIYGQAP